MMLGYVGWRRNTNWVILNTRYEIRVRIKNYDYDYDYDYEHEHEHEQSRKFSGRVCFG